MKLYSILKKVYYIASAKFINKSNFIAPNLYLFNLNKKNLIQVKSILFYFNNLEYMHLGDHLFFLPVVKCFIDSGYSVSVCVTQPMKEVFAKLNLHVVDDVGENFGTYDLVISRFELINRLKQERSLLVHVSKNIDRPICEQIMFELGKYFSLRPYIKPDFTVFNDNTILHKFNLPQDKKLVFFSMYCDASSYLITQKKRDILLSFIRKYANNGDYLVVLLGTYQNKSNDKTVYNFAHVDLRGKTNIVDIFALVSCEQSTYFIGFDAFIMHVFSFFEKNSFVVFRGRITKTQNDMLKKYHVKLFSKDNFVTLLN